VNAPTEATNNYALWVDSGATRLDGTLAVTGVVTANAGVVVDTITIDAGQIDQSSGDLTLDVAGDIVLDADGSGVQLHDNGSFIGLISTNSSNLTRHHI
jgi:hypothetical protein